MEKMKLNDEKDVAYAVSHAPVKLKFDAVYEFIEAIAPVLGREHVESRIAEIKAYEAQPEHTSKCIAFDIEYDLAYLKGIEAIRSFIGRFGEGLKYLVEENAWGITEPNPDPNNEAPVISERVTLEEVINRAAKAGEDLEMKTTIEYGINGNRQWFILDLYGLTTGTQYAQHHIML